MQREFYYFYKNASFMASKYKFPIANKLYILIHPAALALYVSLILLFSSPNYFQKHEAEVISSRVGTFTHNHYIDLNQNGKEELVTTAYNSGIVPKLLLKDYKGKTINQWNFKGKWLEDRLDLIDDYDHNQLKEIYCLTHVKDSIFLHIIEPFKQDGSLLRNRFIDLAGVFNIDQVSVNFVDAKLIDTNGDNFKEYVFILYAGFSKFPRKVYVYDIKNDRLRSSPESAAGISIRCYFQDINNDGVDEVCGKVTAHENIHYSMPYTDSSSWLMVFNLKGKVDFLFPPIEQKTGIGSEIVTTPYQYGEKSYLVSKFYSRSVKQNNDSVRLSILNLDGKTIRSKSYDIADYPHLTSLSTPNLQGNVIYFYDLKGNIYKTDINLILKDHFLLEKQEQLSVNIFRDYHLDIDNDSKDEYILMYNKLNLGMVIYSSELKDPICIDIPSLNGSADWKIDTKTPTIDDPTNIVVNGTNRIVKLRYAKNPKYHWKYPVYFIVYLLFFILFWLLQKAQKSVIAKRYETEKQLYEAEKQLMQQQMALSKKQMEPHFMLNTLNNIGYLFTKDDKQQAMYYFGKFAALIRRGLMYADKVETSLEKEIEFIKDYLILQKHLMDGELDFSIENKEDIDLEKIKVPHSLIYTFVENAIKHGLQLKEKDRVLKVMISKVQNEKIKITIADNGIGRKKSKELGTTDTGKGMTIVKNIVGGYNKLYGGAISYEIRDLVGEGGVVLGTEVVVLV